MIPSSRAESSRKCTYLIQSRTGVYTFRWNVVSDGKHHQPRVSLKTTSGELTEEMIKEYLDHHFEPKVEDNFRTES